MSLAELLAAYLASVRRTPFDASRAREAASVLLETALAREPNELAELMGALAAEVAAAGPSLGISVAMAGALVERGAPHEALASVLLPKVRTWVAQASNALRALLDTSEPGSHAVEPDDEVDEAFAKWVDEHLRASADCQAWLRLHEAHPAAIAVLGASATLRASVRDLVVALSALEPYHVGAGWLRRMLDVLDDEPLVVLHVPDGRGFSCRMGGVASNSDLFVLMADALSSQALECGLDVPRPPAQAVACLRGLGPRDPELTFECPWNAYAYTALRADGTLPKAADYSAAPLWIWGEGEPAEIPALDGSRVVLLGPPGYARVLGIERTFQTLHASFEARPMARLDANAWLDRVARAAADR